MLIPMVFVQMVQHHNLVQLVQNKMFILVLVRLRNSPKLICRHYTNTVTFDKIKMPSAINAVVGIIASRIDLITAREVLNKGITM
jgi:hypothetical protein